MTSETALTLQDQRAAAANDTILWTDLLAESWFEPGDRSAAASRIAAAARQAFDADLCVLYAINPVTQLFIEPPEFAGDLRDPGAESSLKAPRKEGFTRRVLREGIVSVPNPSALDAREANFCSAQEIASFVAVALYTSRRRRPMGVLYIDFRRQLSFPSSLVDKLRQFGRLASRQLEVTWHLRRYQAVARIGQEINRGIENENQLFGELVGRLWRIVDTSRCLVWAVIAAERSRVTFYHRIDGKISTSESTLITGDLEWLLSRGEATMLGTWNDTADGLVAHLGDWLDRLPWSPESVLFVPVRHEGRSLGYILVIHPEPDSYDNEDRHLLQLLSHHIALAASNLRLFIRLDLLYEAGQALTRHLGTADVPNLIIETLRETTRSDLVVLYPFSHATSQFELPPRIAGELRDKNFPQAQGVRNDDIAALTLRQRNPVYCASSSALYGMLGGEKKSRRGNFEQREEIRSTAAVALRVGEEPVGVLFINYRVPQRFDQAQQLLIAGLANYAAIAIKNDREFGAQRGSHLRELELLQEIDRKLSRSSDLENLLGSILDLAAEILHPDKAAIFIHDIERGELVLQAARPSSEKRLHRALKVGKGRGIILKAFHSRLPNLVADVRAPEWRDIFVNVSGGGDTLCELDIPLVDDGEVIGILNCEGRTGGPHWEASIPFLVTLAGQAVLAVRKAQAYESERRLAADRGVLIELAKELAGRLDVKELLDLILKRAIKVTRARAGVLALADAKTDDLIVASVRGTANDKPGRHISRQRGIIGWVARHQRPVNVDLTQKRWQRLHVPGVPGMKSEITVPLMAGAELRGVLNIESPRQWHFRERDARFLSALADLAVIVLQNAERFRDAEERQQKLEALADVGRRVIEQLDDPDEVMRAVAAYALRLTGATISDLDLYRGEKWIVHYRATANGENGPRIERLDLEAPGVQAPPRGIMAWVRENRKSLLVKGDAAKNRLYEGEPGIHSELAVPLYDRAGGLLGILDVTSHAFDAFDDADLKDLELFANQAVIAFANSQNFAEAERSRRRLELLQEVGRELARLTVLSEIKNGYDVIVRAAHQHFQSSVVVRRFNSGTEELLRVSFRTLNAKPPFPRIPISDPLSGRVARERVRLILPDAENPPPEIGPIPRSNRRDRAFVVTPILVGDDYYGNLALSHTEPHYFRGSDIDLVDGLAQQLAITIRRLEEVERRREAEQRAQEAELVSEVGHDTLGLMHRLGNDLGLVPSYILRIKKALSGSQFQDPEAGVLLEQISDDVRGVLNRSSNLREEIAKGWSIEKRPFPIREVIKTALEGLRAHLGKRTGSIRLRRRFPRKLPVVEVDSNQMSTALLNLLVNACEAMPNGGEVEIGAVESGKEVKIWVRDTGHGIESARRAKIFRLGYTTKPRGTGFGLWSVWRTILKHDARIEVESKPGRGATFTISLPLPVERPNG